MKPNFSYMIKWFIRLFSRHSKKQKRNDWGTLPPPPTKRGNVLCGHDYSCGSNSSDASFPINDHSSPGFGLLGVIDALDCPGPSWDSGSSGSEDGGGSSFDGFSGGDGAGGGASGDW